jgi:hypothetical protein
LEHVAVSIFRVKCMVQEVDLYEEAGSRRDRETCKAVKPTCEGATGRDRKVVKVTPLGRE